MIPSSLFTVPIWDDQLPNHEEVNNELVPILRKYKTDNPNVVQSNVNGQQTAKQLHTLEELTSLFEYINFQINRAASSIGLAGKLAVNEAWANFNNGTGCMNLQHTHVGVISGAYYVKVPEGSGSIFLTNPAPIGSWEGLNICPERNHYASETIEVKPLEGTFIMWPSYLPHSVGPNTQNIERLSISFNASLKKD
jgi:uncharacterized protein (TIGR02466 family)